MNLTSTPADRPKLSIAVDLHDCIADWVGSLIGLRGWPDRMTGRVWDWYDNDRDEKEWRKWFDSEEYAGFLEGLDPMYGAGEGIVALLRRFDVTIISAAPACGLGFRATWDWIYRSGKLPLAVSPVNIPLIALGNTTNKRRYLEENAYMFDWLIDDMGIMLDVAHKAGINTARFVAPWNVGQPSDVDVRHWKDIRKFFLGGSPDPGVERSKRLMLMKVPDVD